jgi:hypothetical protein
METAEPKKRKVPKNFRLSDEGERLLLTIGERKGLKQVEVIEMALRRLAELEGLRGTKEGQQATV